MGGDKGLAVVIPAVNQVLQKYSTVDIILVGRQDEIAIALQEHKISDSRISIVNATEVVAMDESPASALRYKKDSSIRVAANLVKDKKADALVSAGNTGALMAISKFVLKTIPGVSRPAIISAMPSINGFSYLLDLGANVNCTAEQLYQFGVMGTVLKKALSKDPDIKPKVALLNIGEEEIKGTESIRAAAQLLSNNPNINYIGYIEGDDIYNDKADIIVCDGFVGNVALKTSEGVSKFIESVFKKAYTRTIYTKLIGLLTRPVLKSVKHILDPENYNGASLLGLNGLVIKSHGGADAKSFANAIVQAKKEIENNVIDRLKDNFMMFTESKE